MGLVDWIYINFSNFPVILLLSILFVIVYFAFKSWDRNEYKVMAVYILSIIFILFVLLAFIEYTNNVQIIINGNSVNNIIVCAIVIVYPIVIMVFLAFMRMFFVKVDKKHGELLEKEVEKTKLAHKRALERHKKYHGSD
ncbi:MAG: hypothetical protein PWQ10_143 [Patescibacteria group bacterium]|nr:hypothetical protein [Patescibacteria group bacterium]